MNASSQEVEIQLSPGQVEGLEKLERFFRGPDRYFILSGKAGTGKTTLIRHAFKHLLKQDRENYEPSHEGNKKIYNVIGIAMSHKAKNNLNLQGGVPYVNTFASAYGHKEVYNKRTGARSFVPDREKMKFADCNRPYKLFIIDEVSMFNAQMVSLVINKTYGFSKILFLGDRGQLPPILMDGEVDCGQDSPIWDLDIPGYCKHELVERVRQTEGNPIVDLSDLIYSEIFSKKPSVWSILDHIKEDGIMSNGNGFMSIDESDVYDMFRASSEDYMDTKIIAYTNRTVRDFNMYMRKFVHNNPTEQFIRDEIIYMNSTYYGREDGINFVFHNSSEYLIRGIEKGEIEGIRVLYAELEESRWMPVVVGQRGHMNYENYHNRLLEYANAKDWKGYWGFKDRFGDFSYGYTLTAYKAQGSTYKNVYVCLGDIIGLMVLSDKRRLQSLYTAITRASHNVFFLKHNGL